VDADREAVQQGVDAIADGGAGVVLRVVGLARIDAEVLQSARQLVGGVVQLGADAARLARDSSEHESDRPGGEEDDQQQDDRRARRARHAVALEPADDGRCDRGDDRRDDHRNHDHLRELEESHHRGHEQRHADDQPRRQAQVSKPGRGGEDPDELGCVDLDVLVLRRAAFAATKAAPQSAADHAVILAAVSVACVRMRA
jgi:hypothetical protein